MAMLNLPELLNIPKLPRYLKSIDDELIRVAKTAGPALEMPLLDTVSASAKRLRPSLLFACSLNSNPTEKLVLGGSAIELLHLGSLVHDDIIDNSDKRWGRPTINSRSLATAVLAGDYLLAQASRQAAELSAGAAKLIADTITALSVGESQEITDKNKLSRRLDSYIGCIEAKTGALISAACQLGGICGGLSASEIGGLAGFGKNLGISFQIIDDLLDILSTPELLGKPTGQDAANGTYTLPVLLSLKGDKASRLKPLLAQTSPEDLANFLIADGSIKRAIKQVKHYNCLAKAALDDFQPAKVSALSALPEAYLNWSLAHLVAEQYRASIAAGL